MLFRSSYAMSGTDMSTAPTHPLCQVSTDAACAATTSALLRKLLIFHPVRYPIPAFVLCISKHRVIIQNKRITAADALKDPWFKTHLGSAELGSESGSKESGNAPPPEPLKLPLDGPELHTVSGGMWGRSGGGVGEEGEGQKKRGREEKGWGGLKGGVLMGGKWWRGWLRGAG
eukprot:2267458-Rhodomonas_salina.1